MTRAITLPYGLVAIVEEADTDRGPSPTHDWTTCPCAVCLARRATTYGK